MWVKCVIVGVDIYVVEGVCGFVWLWLGFVSVMDVRVCIWMSADADVCMGGCGWVWMDVVMSVECGCRFSSLHSGTPTVPSAKTFRSPYRCADVR